MQGDQADGALPERDGPQREGLAHGGIREGAHAQALRVAVGHPHGHDRHAHEGGGGPRDPPQDLVRVQRGGDELVDTRERAETLGLLGRLPEEPRMLERDRRLAGECLGHLLVAPSEEPPSAERQHADDALAHAEGDSHVVRVAEAAIGRHHLGRHGRQLGELTDDSRPGRHDMPGETLALVHLDSRSQHRLRRGPGESRHHQLIAFEQPESSVVEVQQPHGLFGHRGQEGVGGAEGADLLVDLEEGGEIRAAAPLVGKEAGVLDGHRRLVGERSHHLDLRRGERVGLPPVHGDAAPGLALDKDGHGEHAPVALVLDELPRGLIERDGRVVQDVLRPHGRPFANGPAGRPLTHAHAQARHELLGDARRAQIADGVRLGIDAEDARRRRARQTLTALHDGVQDGIGLEVRGEGAADLEEGAIAGGARLLLGEELGIVDGDGGVTGEGEQEVHVFRLESVGSAREHGQGAHEPVAHEKGQSYPRHKAFRQEPGAAGQIQIVLDSLAHGGGAILGRAPGEALTHAQALHDLRGRAAAQARLGAEHQPVAFHEGKAGGPVGDEPARGAHDGVQHISQGAGRREGVAALREGLEAAALLFHLGEEHGPLDHLTDLVSHGLEDLDFLLREVAALLRDERHDPPRPALDGNGESELAAMGPRRLEPGQLGIGDRGGIDVGHDEPPRPRRLADIGTVQRPHADLLGELGRESALGDEGQRARGGIDAVHASDVHLGQRTHDVQHLSRRGQHVGGAAHAEGNGVEGLELAVTTLQLGVGVLRLEGYERGGLARPASRRGTGEN